MVFVDRRRLLVLAAATCWIGWAPAVHADWAACQNKPTRGCLLEEAFRGDSGPLAGKDRLDVLMQGGALIHPEYVTADDAAEAQRAAQTTRNLNYVFLAIEGLVATNQKQQAIELVASFTGGMQLLAITRIVRDLIKAGDAETALALADRMQPPIATSMRPDVQHSVVISAVRILAEVGKTDLALMLMGDPKQLTDIEMADMHMVLAQAFASRGAADLAQGALYRAEMSLEAARRYPTGRVAELRIRFATIKLLALRGRADAVEAALAQLRSDPAASDPGTAYERSQGYRGLVRALLEAKRFEPALSIAKAITPDATRDTVLADIGAMNAMEGRLADARAVLPLLSNGKDAAEESARVVRALAIASAQAGDVASALRLAGEIRNPSLRRGTLYGIAQVLPP